MTNLLPFFFFFEFLGKLLSLGAEKVISFLFFLFEVLFMGKVIFRLCKICPCILRPLVCEKSSSNGRHRKRKKFDGSNLSILVGIQVLIGS